MIKKDMQIRYGSIRLVCTDNTDGGCSVIPVYKETAIGMVKIMPEEVLLELEAEGKELEAKLKRHAISDIVEDAT